MSQPNIELSLHPKQMEAFYHAANELLYGGASGGGKGTILASEANARRLGYNTDSKEDMEEFVMRYGQKVMTPFGEKLIDEMQEGDQVLNPDGSTCEVIAVHPTQHLPCYEITFIDGTTSICDESHLWSVKISGKRTRRKLTHSHRKLADLSSVEDDQERFTLELARRYKTVSMKRLIELHEKAEANAGTDARSYWLSVPLSNPCQFQLPPGKTKMMDYYVLGVWLGDGYKSRRANGFGWSKPVPEIAVEMSRRLASMNCEVTQNPTQKAKGSYCIKGSAFVDALISVGLEECFSYEKFIPKQYLFGPVENRWELLQGLMDTDGTASPDGKVSYCTTSPQLRDDVVFLARSLGFCATASHKPEPKYTYDGEIRIGREAWDIYITGRNRGNLFLANPFKNDRATNIRNEGGRRIVSIKKLKGTFDTRCITVSHPNGLYLTNDFVVTHNSHLMRVATIIWCMMIDNLQVYIFRRLSTDLYKNHMEGVNGFNNMLDPMVKAKLCNIIQPGTIRFSNGSRIFLNHCQYEHNVTQYLGVDIHVLVIDELTHWTQPMYAFLRGRLRATGITIPEELKEAGVRFPRILCGSNPGGIGHNWVKMAFVDSTMKGAQLYNSPREEGGMVRGYLPALLEDNPSIMDDDPEFENRIYGLGNEALVKAMRFGDWDIVAGGMFDDVWDEQRIVLKPFKLPASWTLTRSFDWGESKPFSVGWWAKTDDSEVEIAPGVFKTFYPGSWVRFAEWYGWQEGKPNVGCGISSTEIAKGILERESKMQIRGIVRKGVADSAIFDANDGVSIAARMSVAGVEWEKADKRPGSRVQGWSLLRELLEGAAKTPMDGPGLFVFSTCQHFIRTIPTLPRDRNNQDDVDTEAEDHIGDDTRYRIWKQDSSLAEVKLFG